jgi:hypothetical protein
MKVVAEMSDIRFELTDEEFAVASKSDITVRSVFDDRLTAKRGLVVRPTRKLIVNSVRSS